LGDDFPSKVELPQSDDESADPAHPNARGEVLIRLRFSPFAGPPWLGKTTALDSEVTVAAGDFRLVPGAP